MNCFNGEAYLEQALRSIENQTYQDWEIVFWDNASSDRSKEIALRHLPKLRYFCSETTLPLGEARMLAVQQARGELIAFLDTDDLYYPMRLEKTVDAMRDETFAMCYAGVDEILPDGKRLRRVAPLHDSGMIFSGLLKEFDVNIPTWTIRKSVLEKHGFSFSANCHCSEEYNLSLRIAARERIATINEFLGAWRCHPHSTTDRTISRWATEREETLAQVIRENPGIEEIYPKEFREAFARAGYYRARNYVSRGEKALARKELSKTITQGPKYLFLFLILFFPAWVWRAFHSTWIKRRAVPFLLGYAR